VAIRYDPVSCQLWLDPVNPDDRHGQFLCLDHAERLSPPRGWVVVDRRGAQTAIRTSAPVATVPRVVPRRVARRRWGSFEEPTLEFSRDDATVGSTDLTVLVRPAELEPQVVEGPTEAEPSPDPTTEPRGEQLPEPPPVPPEPVTAPVDERDGSAPDDDPAVVDDLTKLLQPRGGLLGRAFESTGHQRSALTIADPNDE
jgi:hypothetical protein